MRPLVQAPITPLRTNGGRCLRGQYLRLHLRLLRLQLLLHRRRPVLPGAPHGVLRRRAQARTVRAGTRRRRARLRSGGRRHAHPPRARHHARRRTRRDVRLWHDARRAAVLPREARSHVGGLRWAHHARRAVAVVRRLHAVRRHTGRTGARVDAHPRQVLQQRRLPRAGAPARTGCPAPATAAQGATATRASVALVLGRRSVHRHLLAVELVRLLHHLLHRPWRVVRDEADAAVLARHVVLGHVGIADGPELLKVGSEVGVRHRALDARNEDARRRAALRAGALPAAGAVTAQLAAGHSLLHFHRAAVHLVRVRAHALGHALILVRNEAKAAALARAALGHHHRFGQLAESLKVLA
mmetsp:Transcript_1260/g.3655  ORF Transcript_1260/g.3655 Transcript_1260/m.3655 type:complete len:356 (+) Transcript_1260:1805-2872(+)